MSSKMKATLEINVNLSDLGENHYSEIKKNSKNKYSNMLDYEIEDASRI